MCVCVSSGALSDCLFPHDLSPPLSGWALLPPTQAFPPSQMFPDPSAVGYHPHSEDLHQVVCVCVCVCVCYVRNKFCVFFPAGAFTDCPFLLTQFPLHREGLPSILDLPKPLIQDRWSRLLCRLLWCPTHTKVCVGVGVHVHGNGWCYLYIFVCMAYSMRIDSSNICGIVQTYSMRMDSSNICGIVQTYTMRMDSSNICRIVQTHIFPQLLVVFTLLY